VYLHIGLHKTGTTYLQGTLRANSSELAEQGVFLPTGPGGPVFRGVDDLQGRRPRKANDDRVEGAWAALVSSIQQCGLPNALVSDERLSLSGVPAVNRVRRSFGASELHVVVTVRDLARVLVSSWEEAVRGAATWTWEHYVAAVRDPAVRGANPARGFWVRQDLGQICAAWEVAVPPERIHVVTVPPRGADRRLLLDRFAGCVGFDGGKLVNEAGRSNESTGVAGTEVIRRLNEGLGGRLNQRQYDRAVQYVIAPRLARSAGRAVLPETELDWVRARAEQDCAMVRERGYAVAGDLDDLLPIAEEGRRPDEATEAELLDAAVEGLTVAAERYAKLWWANRRADAPPEAAASTIASRARGVAFRARRAVLDAGDRGGPLGRVVSMAYRARELRQERARQSARRNRAAG
jgi:hypothetical protein